MSSSASLVGEHHGLDQESVVGIEAGALGAQAQRADGQRASHLGLGACAGPRRLGRAGRAGKAAAQMDHGARLARIAQLQHQPALLGRSSMRYPRARGARARRTCARAR